MTDHHQTSQTIRSIRWHPKPMDAHPRPQPHRRRHNHRQHLRQHPRKLFPQRRSNFQRKRRNQHRRHPIPRRGLHRLQTRLPSLLHRLRGAIPSLQPDHRQLLASDWRPCRIRRSRSPRFLRHPDPNIPAPSERGPIRQSLRHDIGSRRAGVARTRIYVRALLCGASRESVGNRGRAWFSTSLAHMQQSITEYASGPVLAEDARFVSPPTTAIWKAMCYSQLVNEYVTPPVLLFFPRCCSSLLHKH